MSIEKQFGAPVPGWSPRPLPGFDARESGYARIERLDAAIHAADLHRANQGDDGIWDYLPYGPFADEAGYRAWAQDMAALADPRFYVVRDLRTGRCGGVASLMRMDPENGVIEVGHINFAPELQRTRAATEAIYLLMSWVFEAGYRRFEWKCDALNMGSRRAAERFGFSFEGVFRQAVVTRGRNRDTAWFACIDADWPGLRAAYQTWLSPGNFDAEGRQKASLAALTAPVRVSDDPVLSGRAGAEEQG